MVQMIKRDFRVCQQLHYQATFAELYAALRAKAIAQGYTNEAELRGSIGPFDHDF